MSTSPIYDFAGKVVTITGGSRGLGHAMAMGFARAGANVAIASRKIEACESTVQKSARSAPTVPRTAYTSGCGAIANASLTRFTRDGADATF
ncbi:MAG: SDR family NAD(P)-dependent oxidoreductase [Candidatus Binatus sp.]